MMHFPSRRAVLGTASALTLLALTTACGGNVAGGAADTSKYPNGPVTLTVGQAAGGSTDLIARALAEGATKSLGAPMPVVNKPGANGALATKEVAGKPADGQELILVTASLITITPLAVSADEAVKIEDLDIIAGLSQDDYVLVASPDSGFKSFDDVTGAGRNITFGTTGVGTGSQLAQTVLFKQANVQGTDVPFDSGKPALTAVLGNQVELATIQLGEAMPQIEAGKVTPLLVFSEARNSFLPDVPSAKEAGYDVPVAQYRAVAAPKGTPQDVKDKLLASFQETFKSEAYQEFNKKNMLTPKEISGEEVTTQWKDYAAKYKALVEQYGISLGGNK
ncbi:tripartite tricarboxylate transporter substrate binding protein [Pseudarthrobacter sp. J75]|uniref:tripartite tricarboxylate transporter substrate binding protein n=1 Tax=unclassified Pseudarthrobacter TaxID=2647000 RepID=UPI002E800B7F|nr:MULTISPECIES: tripartite tricarboxylate transporter substrate binding protein [unclassified Pseudarthrobacter]MEE2521970.1 tripartite tricarboxylate transporter substrate binding protein [Pseudarthrobacter sp. J47]MEE2528895.1 tripartite tricarboxylate transporter substrate binding protein [Pseudarthrobacter sp. J75]